MSVTEEAGGAEFGAWRVIKIGAQIVSSRVSHYATLGLLSAVPEIIVALAGAPALFQQAVGLMVLAALQAVVVYSVMNDLRGEPEPLGQTIRTGLQRYLRALGAAVLVLVIVMGPMTVILTLMQFGLAPLVALPLVMVASVCALWFSVRYYLATPAAVVEELTPIESLRRSAELVKNNGWTVFGVAILPALALMSPLFFVIAGQQPIGEDGVEPQPPSLTLAILVQLYSSIVYPAILVIADVAFFTLRKVKEGVDP